MPVMGLDIGTTGAKAAVVDAEGRTLASAHRDYPLIARHPGWLELDPRQVLEAVDGVIAESAGQAYRITGRRVRALAAAVMGEAITPVDAQGRPLDNSITAIDVRAHRQIAGLAADGVEPSHFFEITGQTLHPILSLAKLLWWRDEKPEVFAGARWFLCWTDLLALWLGLEPSIPPSLAARTGLYDIGRGDWSDLLLDRIGIARERLARIVPAGHAVGEIGPEVCRRLGLAPGCVLASGGWDQACTALGANAVEPGVVVDSMGSTDSLNATYADINTSSALREAHLTCTPHALPGLFCTNAFSACGGNVLRWWRDEFALAEQIEAERSGRNAYDLIVERALDAPAPPLALAHFAGAGTPYMDPLSRGAFLDLSLSTTRAQMARALLEGVAFEMAVNLDCLRKAGIPVLRILCGSGGARNGRLLQLRADVFLMPVTRLENEELGILACAMLARHALDSGAGSPARADWVVYGPTYEPDLRKAEEYGARLEAYRTLYDTLRPVNHSRTGS